jgi:hypothetical protein
VAIGNTDQVVVVQPDERVVDGLGRVPLEVGHDFLDGNRPASLQENLQNARGRRGFSGGAPRLAASPNVEGNELIGRQDREARHWWPSLRAR